MSKEKVRGTTILFSTEQDGNVMKYQTFHDRVGQESCWDPSVTVDLYSFDSRDPRVPDGGSREEHCLSSRVEECSCETSTLYLRDEREDPCLPFGVPSGPDRRCECSDVVGAPVLSCDHCLPLGGASVVTSPGLAFCRVTNPSYWVVRLDTKLP